MQNSQKIERQSCLSLSKCPSQRDKDLLLCEVDADQQPDGGADEVAQEEANVPTGGEQCPADDEGEGQHVMGDLVAHVQEDAVLAGVVQRPPLRPVAVVVANVDHQVKEGEDGRGHAPGDGDEGERPEVLVDGNGQSESGELEERSQNDQRYEPLAEARPRLVIVDQYVAHLEADQREHYRGGGPQKAFRVVPQLQPSSWVVEDRAEEALVAVLGGEEQLIDLAGSATGAVRVVHVVVQSPGS